MKRVLLLAALAVGTGGCADLLLGPEPDPENAVASFDALWDEFDRYYSFFQLKAIDWDGLRDTYRPQAQDAEDGQDLLRVFGRLLNHLQDGHVNVYTPNGDYSYLGWYADATRSYHPSAVLSRIENLDRVEGGTLTFGTPEPGVGYVRIPTFAPGMAGELDRALATLEANGPLDALIVDVRHNAGGSDTEARDVAGRFAVDRRLYRTVRVRNGPEHDDFTDPVPSYVEPMGRTFTGPTAVLTNRRTFSSAESFVLATRIMPQVTVVGDTTGGGSGRPVLRELPNGWTYRFSRWVAFDPQGRTFEGEGLVPERVVTFDDQAILDVILEDAIQVLGAEIQGS